MNFSKVLATNVCYGTTLFYGGQLGLAKKNHCHKLANNRLFFHWQIFRIPIVTLVLQYNFLILTCTLRNYLLFKVRTFWETHKIWKNLPPGFDKSADLLSKRQNHEEDFFKLCVLLKKFELYQHKTHFFVFSM